MLRRLFSSITILTLLFVGFNPYFAHAFDPVSPQATRIEGLLVVDVSKSMDESDPNKISNEAMKMFVDMLSLQGDKLGVIAYAAGVMREKGLIEIESAQDKNDLKEFIDSLEKYPFTDMSTGVKEAVKVLDSGHQEGYTPLIVLLADGNNDLSNHKGKTTQQADKDLAQAVSAAKAKGYPIYTIGLNADGNLNKDVLQNIAKTTNGKFFETSKADSLPDILSEIFANHSKLKIVSLDSIVANGDFQDIKVNVPNDNVIEANISLMASNPVEVRLIDPAGQELPLTSESLHISTSATYTMIKMIKPVQGDWLLKVKGVPQNKIDINLIFNYDLQLKLAPLSTQPYKTGDKLKIDAFFEDNGVTVSNEQLYQSMKANLYIKDLDKRTTEEISLTPTMKGFTGELTLGDASEYEVMVRADDNSFYRETQSQKLTVIDPPADIPTTSIPDTDTDSNTDNGSIPWRNILIGVIALIVLAALVLIIKRIIESLNRGFTGQIRIEIQDEETGESTEPDYRPLKDFTRKIHLNELLYLSDEFTEIAHQISFKPLSGDKLMLFNKSDSTIEKNGRTIDAKKGYEVRRNDRLRIVLKEENKSINLEYIS